MEEVYDHILEIRIDNTRTRNIMKDQAEEELSMHPMEVFRAFYQEVQGQPMGEEEEELIQKALDEWEEER